MIETIERKEIDGRTVELRKFSDVYVIYVWPRERTLKVVRIDELGVFNTLKEAQVFMSTLERLD